MDDPALQQALHEHQAGRLEQAKALYQHFLLEQPDHANAQQLLGMLFGQTAQYEAALHYLEKALESKTKDPSLHNALGNVHKHLGHTDKAKIHYQAALTLMPNHASSYNNLGILHLNEKDIETAQGYFMQALAQKVDYPDALYNLSLSYIHQQKPGKAIEKLKQCVEIDPSYLQAQTQLAQLYHQTNEWNKAKKCFLKACELDAKHIPAQIGLGATYLALNQTKEAKECFYQALNLDPKQVEAHHNLGSLYLTQRNLDKALAHWQKVIAEDQSADSYFNVGVVYQYQNRFQDAKQYFTLAVQKDPQHEKSLNNLAAIALRHGDFEEAKLNFSKILSKHPAHPQALFGMQALDETSKKTFDQAPKDYITDLFDDYADHYDQHLVDSLQYALPDTIENALLKHFPQLVDYQTPDDDQDAKDNKQLSLLDLGCGTGLCALPLASYFTNMVGVDLSQKMLDRASKKGIYQSLICQDLLTYLNQTQDQAFDCIMACDTLPYIGSLDQLFAQIKAKLKPGGLSLLSVEKLEDACLDYKLQNNLRFAHSKHYIQKLAKKHGFEQINISHVVFRKQHEKPVSGLLIALRFKS
jgi:predicted TPR repeat methyltransferase/lipoprotein NlpI